jgi:S-adenosylmethionine decarboxylase proenzyme
MESKLFTLGRHLLAEFYDCEPNILNNVSLIENEMTQAAVLAGATIVQKNFHHFSPYGVSGVVVIAESHLAIHTWPEYGYAAVDLFTCGESVDPVIAYEHLRKQLHASTAFYSELKRGLLNEESGQLLKAPFKVEVEHEHLVLTGGGCSV